MRTQYENQRNESVTIQTDTETKRGDGVRLCIKWDQEART